MSITGGYDLHRLALGVGPSFLDATGTPRCGRASAPLSDCVPLDFLHGRNGFSDAMFDAIAVQAGAREDRRLRSATVAASGELLTLPAGPVTMATGLEWREERGAVDMDALLADDAVDFGGFAPDPISGRIAVREAWLEFDLPLLSTRPGVRTLSLSLATRFSDYSTFGGTSNHKLALAWRPRAGLLLRAAWSQGFRAPSTDELFALSGTLQFGSAAVVFLDPCVAPPDATTAARCRADGVPAEGFDPQMAPQIRIGSNPGLQPERARNRSLGVVWSPATIDGLDLTLDWWRIELHDTIDSIGYPELPRLCYVQGIAGACAQLQRDRSTGVLTGIDARLYNYGVYEIEGFDLAVDYRWSSRLGDFRLRWDSVYLARHLRELPADAPPTSLVGNYHFWDPGWRLRSLLSLDWHYRQVGTTLRLRYYPALDESCEFPANAGRLDLCDRPDVRSPVFGGAPEHIIGARTYVDLQLRWEPRTGMQFSFGVDNATNRDPPVAYSTFNSYDPAYDLPGRFWHVGYRHQF
ncbi:MAG TPA: TonB-dependent receptor [Luteimonas sp.]|nr:TonB-dependent receptor [Luteimonas sp.]